MYYFISKKGAVKNQHTRIIFYLKKPKIIIIIKFMTVLLTDKLISLLKLKEYKSNNKKIFKSIKKKLYFVVTIMTSKQWNFNFKGHKMTS